MYLNFFGLNEKPFAITPDPRYLFMSERHGEGLAHLVYGVTESGGFIQLTGEVGTGKTTLVRTLLGQVPDEVDLAVILNPQVTALEFLLGICEELGVALPADTGSKKALVDALNSHLLAAHARGRRTILLVDEAQNLDPDVLEQVRLLTNLETSKQKLLQIILIGQPELRELLAQNNLRQLAQRVTGRYHLEPLTRDETQRYIAHRLKVAGALTGIFEPSACRAVYRLSGGIPRLVNVICDRALLGAYSEESRQVTRRIVERAAREVSGNSMRAAWRWLVPAAAAGVAVVVIAWLQWQPLPREQANAPATVGLPVAAADDAGPTSDDVAAPAETPAALPDAVPPADATAAEPAPGQPSLTDDLGTLPTSVDDAMGTLLGLWSAQFESGAGTACNQAATQGLSCLYQRASWAVVRQLNRPAMLTLTDTDGTSYYPVVTAVGEDTVELAFGDARRTYPEDEVTDLWFGQYLLLWRPPHGRVTSLRPGSRGEDVVWLRESLAALDPAYETRPEQPDLFDAELEQRLRDFQRRNRLDVDGLAGQHTQILINSLLAAENTPRLVGGTK